MESNVNTILQEIEKIYSSDHNKKAIWDKCLNEQPKTLQIYKRYLDGEVPKYFHVSDDFNNDELSRTVYEVECTYRFLREVFNVKIALEEVAKVSCSIYRDYYEKKDDVLHRVKINYFEILELLERAYIYAKIKNTAKILDVNNDDDGFRVSDNDVRKKLKTAISHAIINLFPFITFFEKKNTSKILSTDDADSDVSVIDKEVRKKLETAIYNAVINLFPSIGDKAILEIISKQAIDSMIIKDRNK